MNDVTTDSCITLVHNCENMNEHVKIHSSLKIQQNTFTTQVLVTGRLKFGNKHKKIECRYFEKVSSDSNT